MRARTKRAEDWPEHFKCCQKNIDDSTPFADKKINVDQTNPIMLGYTCPFCGSECPIELAMKYLGMPSGYVPVSVLEFDEGASSESNPTQITNS